MQAVSRTYHLTAEEIEKERFEIEAAKKNPENFSVLYDRYYLRIYRFIFQRVDDEENCADICAQVFMKALQKIGSFKHKGLPFGSWLFRIASNEVNLFYRGQKKDRAFLVRPDDLIHIMDVCEEDEQQQFQTMRLLRFLEKLKKEDMELIEMRYFEKRPYQEIASITGLSENNLKVKVHRIILKLRKMFYKYTPES